VSKQLPIIVCDSREQTPWSFAADVAITVTRALPAGDYSLDGHEWTVAIERKSLDDFVGSIIHDWIRFRAELRRLASFEHAVIVVEANAGDVLTRQYRSEVHPNSVIGRAMAIHADYGVPFLFWGARPVARLLAERQLLLWHKRLTGNPTCQPIVSAEAT
jgi:ERCC4-type nuclease